MPARQAPASAPSRNLTAERSRALRCLVSPGSTPRPMATIEQRILDALPGIVCTVDLDGRVTGINRSHTHTADTAGSPSTDSQESIGAPVHQALGSAGTRDQLESAMTLLRTGRAQHVSWEVPGDGESDGATLLVQATPLLDRASVTGF